MSQIEKIPIIVGVTGHRNIMEEDKPQLKQTVIDCLKEIQALCKCEGGDDTPIIMLNAFAQGADMLCAEAAFELGIDVYGVLPREKERYINSLDNEADKNKFNDYLTRAKRVFVAPDIEKNKSWLKKTNSNIDDEGYESRQLGIYIAEHSHILLALWDGTPPSEQFGWGTVEVIKFALEHNFLDKEHLFKPGTINDSAVAWIKSRREGDGAQANIERKWLISNLESRAEHKQEYITSEEPPQFLKEIISKTVKYNNHSVGISVGSAKLWKNADDLDEYRRMVDYHYAKADELSYSGNQRKYNLFLLLIAIIGTVVACSFLIYDDASLPFMIFPCSIAVGVIIWLCYFGRKRAYHKAYIDYRAFAEALRIQFYMSLCLKEKEIVTNVCDLYSWTQKVDSVWIDKALRAIAVISKTDKIKLTASDVVEVWIGESDSPKGQLKYHAQKRISNKKQAKKYETFSRVFRCAAIAIYFVIFAFEITACILKACNIDWFWENNMFAQISWRNFCAMILGVFAAGSLLFSSYWGKLSFDRKWEDNEKMCKFYGSAYARWHEAKVHHNDEIEKFVKEIARE
ncbi:MAG: hypothetical protein K2N23_02920, partial [Clostridia bacterium]|nr:hypothetical protein [Clostridia bacterium]